MSKAHDWNDHGGGFGTKELNKKKKKNLNYPTKRKGMSGLETK